MDRLVDEINQRLQSIVDSFKEGKVRDAMSYSLMAGGKRIRPVIMLTVIRTYQQDYHPYIDIACAIEMIHTYSLIHDDLPGMDDDDLRRGQPTCHKRFDEGTAILAGDALLNEAGNIILNCPIDDVLKIDILKELFQASGLNGMIYGQQQDIYYEDRKANLEQLKDIHHYKTGAMIAASFVLGSLIAAPEDKEIWRSIGYDIGLAFQIQDDVLDVVGDEEVLGKTTGSDALHHKSTFVSLLGIEESNRYIKDLFEKCYETLYSMQINHGLMLELFEKLIKRVS